MKKSLLERAMAAPTIKRLKRKLRDGELELTLAYVRGEISLRQYGTAIGWGRKGNGSITHRVGSVIRQAVASGELRLVVNKRK